MPFYMSCVSGDCDAVLLKHAEARASQPVTSSFEMIPKTMLHHSNQCQQGDKKQISSGQI